MSTLFATSSPASALIWWVIPLVALLGGIGYAVWVSKFQDRYEKQTNRSVGNFKRFQDSFRNSNSPD